MVQLVPDTAELTFLFEGVPASDLDGCEAQSSLYVRDTLGAWTQLTLNALAAYGRDWWLNGKNANPGFRLNFSQQWELKQVVARDLGAVNGLQSALVVNDVGGNAGDAVSPNVAVLYKFQCDPGGSPDQGWVFWCAGTEGDCFGNNWGVGFTTVIDQRMDDFDADLNDPTAGGNAAWAQVRVSRSSGTMNVTKKKAVPRVTAVTNTIASGATRLEIASQRDRRASI